MIYEKRIYQEQAIEKGVWSLQERDKPNLLVLACGAGKSLIQARIARELNDYTLVLQPTKEILEQNYAKALSYDLEDIGIYSASMKRKDFGLLTYATLKSIYTKPEEFKHFKHIIIDEAHDVDPKNMPTKTKEGGMFGKFINAIGNPTVLGMTATPYRNVQKFIKEDVIEEGREEKATFYTSTLQPLNRIPPFYFSSMIYRVETEYLIRNKYLRRPIYDLKYCNAFDYDKLKLNSTGADFDQFQLEAFVNQPDRIKNIIQACCDYDSIVQRNIVFCSSIKQAHNLSKLAKDWGMNTEVISSTNTGKERTTIIKRFREGEIKHLFNVGIMTTGIDIPSLDCITYGKPTLSVNLWTQSCGRPIRVDPNNPTKQPYILDVAGVSKRLGKAESIRIEKEDIINSDGTTSKGFKDIVVSEVGVISGFPLSKFRVKDESKIH